MSRSPFQVNRMKPLRGGGWLDPSSTRLTVFLTCILLISLCFLCQTRTVVIDSAVNLQASLRKGGDHEKVLVVEDLGRKNIGAISTGIPRRGSSMECDFSEVRTDVCEIHGDDIRVHGPSSSIVRVLPSSTTEDDDDNSNSSSSSSWSNIIKIKPYPRKWEQITMSHIRELSIINSSSEFDFNNVSNQIINYSRCNARYTSPAVVFSTGGFRQNFFHEIVDALIPIFLTSYRFHGDVHFLIHDFSPTWVNRYLPVLRMLSRQDEIVNLDEDERVHCFTHVVVGLNSTMEMGIDPAKSPMGPSMLDFTALLRLRFALPREFVEKKKKWQISRLLLLSRKETRVLLNERQVVEMVRGMGYEVLVATPEITRNLTLMARMVNSCDVVLGVHGAGLTNMVFLPTNATLIQIIPLGGMLYPGRYSYGDPAIGMGLRYADYEITMDESSLINKYPRDHAVFTDPLSIHKQGFYAMWSIFWHQDIMLDVGRFRVFLSKALSMTSD